MPEIKLRLPSLLGLRIVVTRAAHQAGELLTAFEAAGASAVSLPLIEVVAAESEPLERAAAAIASFDWLAFTSANAVRAFLSRTAGADLPPTAVVGPATAAALRAHGVEPHLETPEPRATGLAAALAAEIEPGARILVPQAADARPHLVDELRSRGAEVTAIVAYRKRLPAASRQLAGVLFADSPLGWVTFTSPRIVDHFVEVLGSSWERRRGELRAISIGPVTSEALRRRGVDPAAEASDPSPDAMVRAVRERVESATDE